MRKGDVKKPNHHTPGFIFHWNKVSKITHNVVDSGVKEFLAHGGRIQKIPPQRSPATYHVRFKREEPYETLEHWSPLF